MSAEYSEDRLVQQTTANFFEQTLKWHSVYAYQRETFGTNGTLGRKNKKEVVLTRYLRQALEKLNPGHPQQVYDDAVERQLQRMLKQNSSRIDYYARYQQIIQDYNRETDRVTIEQTFEELLKLVQVLSEEDTRTIREGLSEEHLAVFDLLCASKDNLDTKAINRVKQVAQLLIEAIKAQLKQLENWRDKESTKATIKSFIYDYLYSEDTGLPIDTYDDSDVDNLSNIVFLHVYQQYESAENHPYAA